MVIRVAALLLFVAMIGATAFGGGNKSSAATIFVPMKRWEDRTQTSPQLAQQVWGAGCRLRDGIAFACEKALALGVSQAEVFVPLQAQMVYLILSAALRALGRAAVGDPGGAVRARGSPRAWN